MNRMIEILAPGGDSDSVKAAILAGADAVYCGLSAFNARARAENISIDILSSLVRIAHDHKCRIYLTLNTLVSDSEFPELVSILNRVRDIGVDAIIVQDTGLLYVIRKNFPSIEVHASTQMTTHNAGQIGFLSKAGVKQVNIARELSLPEVTEMCVHAHTAGIKIEVFVHGAYCISFSGQCYMSSAVCGESGNRGLCVQPCRREYFIPEKNTIGVPFNLKDNSAFSSAADLVEAGVDAFKIEGRIKNYTYVHTVISAWRRQIDHLALSGTAEKNDITLSMVFNRGFSDGYLKGHITTGMFAETSRDVSMVRVSAVTSYSADGKILALEKDAHIAPGTEVLIYADDRDFICRGTIGEKTAGSTYRFRIDHKLKGKITKGCILYMLPEIPGGNDLKKRIDELDVLKKSLSITICGSIGRKLEAVFASEERSAVFHSESKLEKSNSTSGLKDIIKEKMCQLGTSPFRLETIDLTGLEEGLFLPVKEINDLRRKGVSALDEEIQVFPEVSLPELLCGHVSRGNKPSLACIVSDFGDTDIADNVDCLVLFELPSSMNGGAGPFADFFRKNPEIIPWFPAILIGKDHAAACDLLSIIRPPYIITDNSGIGIEASTKGINWIAGPMLNSTNSYSLRCLHEFAGCSGAFISHEAGKDQIAGIYPPESFALWYQVYNPVLAMNTRQCVLRNCIHCEKTETDERCLQECSRHATVYDSGNNPLSIEKRRGFYNQVYYGKHYLNLDVLHDLPGMFSTFVIDLRNTGINETVHAPKRELVNLFLSWIDDKPGSRERIRKVIKDTTSGLYTRGL